MPTVVYHLVPSKARPYGDVATPLGRHLSPVTKLKFLRGDYVDLFSLLNTELDEKELEKEDEVGKERYLCKKPEHSWANWLPGYTIYMGTPTIYMGVIIAAQPWHALSLIQYQDLIYRAYVDFPGHTWLSYNGNFCKCADQEPELQWDEPLASLWLQIMMPARTAVGDRFDSGHLIQGSTQQGNHHAFTIREIPISMVREVANGSHASLSMNVRYVGDTETCPAPRCGVSMVQ